jgi:hypothetical protein
MRHEIARLEIAYLTRSYACHIKVAKPLIHEVVGLLESRNQRTEVSIFLRGAIISMFTKRLEQQVYRELFEGPCRTIHGALSLSIDRRAAPNRLYSRRKAARSRSSGELQKSLLP